MTTIEFFSILLDLYPPAGPGLIRQRSLRHDGSRFDRSGCALVTVEPLPDAGEALPVVAEQRRALRAVEEHPHTLAWLGATQGC